ncbi:MAG: flavin reductase family protein [Candidatus Eisenbacteria bacterium]
MILDLDQLPARERHQLLIGTVVPRPIAFVSTIGAGGHNVAPFSYFALIATTPPLLGVSIGLRRGAPKDTLRNVRETGDFVVNVVDEAMIRQVVQASGEWPYGEDEFAIAGLTPVGSERVRSPRVAESPVSYECTVERIVDFDATSLVVGRIVRAHVRDDLFHDGRVDPARLRPVSRLGAEDYAPVREVFALARPRVDARGPGS